MISHSVKHGYKYSKGYIIIILLSLFWAVIFSASFCTSSSGLKNNEKQPESLSSVAGSSSDSASDSNRNDLTMPSLSNGSFRYDLDNPDAKYLLPEYLVEISGLAYYKEDRILCVQDEKATIYVFNLDKKEIVNKYEFGHDADYEDIAVIGQTAYVIRSDGNIFEVKNFDQGNRNVKEHKTPLSEKNDTEGVAYDKISNSLFIACKGSPAIKKENLHKGYKAVYQFDLGEQKLDKEPAFIIDLNSPDCYKDDKLFKEFSLKSAKKRYQMVENETGFQPSGIAIHPVSHEIYLISSIGKNLIIIDRQGKVLYLHDLDTRIFRQPEGICFSPSGDLFISNEGDRKAGYILKFNLRKD